MLIKNLYEEFKMEISSNLTSNTDRISENH